MIYVTSEKMKATKILEELIGYFFNHNIDHLQMELEYKNIEFMIKVQGICSSKPYDLDHLDEMLNTPRQAELEEYYWGLLGGNSQRQELNLLGSLVDFSEGSLSVTVYRKTHH